MAWTVPRTWVAGETTSATIFNQHVRDNLLFLHDNRVSAIPGSPVDQDEIVYIADAANRYLWRLKFNAGGSAGQQWENVGGSPLAANVELQEALSSTTSYVNFTTVVQLTVPLAGVYYAAYGAAWYAAASVNHYLAPQFGAAATTDSDAAISVIGAGFSGSLARESGLKTLTAGALVGLQYRQGTGTAAEQAAGKYLRVHPVRVG